MRLGLGVVGVMMWCGCAGGSGKVATGPTQAERPPLSARLPPGAWIAGHVDLSASGIGALLATSPTAQQMRPALERCGFDLARDAGGVEAAMSRGGDIVIELAGKADVKTLACVVGEPAPAGSTLELPFVSARNLEGGLHVDIPAGGAGKHAVPGAEQALAGWIAENPAGEYAVHAVVGAGDDRLAVALTESRQHARLRLRFGRKDDAAAVAAWLDELIGRSKLAGMQLAHAGADVTVDIDMARWPSLQPAIRGQMVESFAQSSGSMMPTLLVGDSFLVAKGSFAGAMPRRGDLIVFSYPREPEKRLVKRVVAIGGDHVRVEADAVTLDGQPLAATLESSDYSLSDEGGPTSVTVHAQVWREQLDGRSYTTLRMAEGGVATAVDMVVPAGEVFVLGDNRDNSHDSRFWGTLPVASIVGRVVIIWWSSSADGLERIGLRPR